MSEFLTLLCRETERGWVWLYTAGMPERGRAERGAELESDAWEHEAFAARGGERFGPQFLRRFILGIPADVSWRLELGEEGFDRRNWPEVVIAGLLVVATFVLLPCSILLLPNAAPGLSRDSATLDTLFFVQVLVVMLLIILPGVLVIDRWPVAAGLLILIGACCLMAVFWWLLQAMVTIILGATAAVVASFHLRRVQRR